MERIISRSVDTVIQGKKRKSCLIFIKPQSISSCLFVSRPIAEITDSIISQCSAGTRFYSHVGCSEITTTRESELSEQRNVPSLPAPRIPSLGRLISPVLFEGKTLGVDGDCSKDEAAGVPSWDGRWEVRKRGQAHIFLFQLCGCCSATDWFLPSKKWVSFHKRPAWGLCS